MIQQTLGTLHHFVPSRTQVWDEPAGILLLNRLAQAMQNRPTGGLHRIGGRMKMPIELVEAKQVGAVLHHCAGGIGKAETGRMLRLQREKFSSSGQRIKARCQRFGALIRADQQRVGPMAIASTGYQGVYHVHIGASTGHNALLQVLHHAQLHVFKRHTVGERFRRKAHQQPRQPQLLRHSTGQHVIGIEMRHV